MWKQFVFFGISFLLCLATSAQESQPKAKSKPAPKKRAENPVLKPIDDQPGLPRVLLIGDSISMGYTIAVREELKGRANVHRPLTNCGPTTNGLANLDKWLGGKPWDVIHFNWGLHDLKYTDEKGALASPPDPTARQQVPPDQYEKNLRDLVTRLKKTGATLVWGTTTPVPEGAAGRVADDSIKYNEVAAKVMRENSIAIDDLHAFSLSRLKDTQRPANVHFSAEGSRVLAKQVAQSITAALDLRQKKQ
jgi:hypothetical protein